MIDLEHLATWRGRSRTDTDLIAPRPARLMAATVDRPGPAPAIGEPLPPLWHWLYFLEAEPPGALGRDGHPARGGFLPPVPLPNRMWAGGRVTFEAPLPVGATVQKRSTIQSVSHKRGRSGDLVFVTVRHELSIEGRRCVDEEQDIVYRDPASASTSTPASASTSASAAASTSIAGDPATHRRDWIPDAVQLFRYSALTFNGHRIHYDADYCRTVEGYADRVVHGPLAATLLAALAVESSAVRLEHFEYRGLAPVLLGMTIGLHARRDGPVADVWSVRPDGVVAMQARARFAAQR